ncbi:ribokinase [Priestia megaterium]|uniref:Ribokinase n=1 Tax=Priestia megaterium (strain ATCC 14581 / DSM 32 / CCUG 1817 / JCM 2506 / NBRC 15308 / NCIMB 9376 / NCTC 10342 / NRRL B-14308 / VKM B-512 / Ford 19) TaxID=1348623 RepID=A0A0B6AU29_PRIM2|nr:ribokinase [Priestia megaterium]AJI24657.1 ribokinase [Priestia megaterium NBRC 15308 = ATCC 14581]KFM97502.1 ribokinase [Priestia megaterium]KGJ76163.1 ribokinase [Priestia megaterium NBRC 15308 = ATCC 14581]MBU8752135.1 ribokinase [Priestia megaterium]MDR4232256.1 ribokinase [Priestia megaterium]
MAKVTVIGSSSMDLVVTSNIRPGAGETVLGESFKTVPGGKGANQAVAAARLGADVSMIGCVGEDHYGKAILENFKSNGVSVKNVKPVTDLDSGTAHIILAEGDNSIVVVKGANDYITPDYVEKAKEKIKDADIVLIQQEIPEETVEYVAQLCQELKVPLLLNPAPARPLKAEVIEQVSYITPNEHEAELLFEGKEKEEVLKQYPNKLFITEGKQGVRYFNGEKEVLVPSYQVETVDTTGAGDTFNAALAVALAERMGFEKGIQFANRAASLSVTKFGAQGGMPTRKEVEESL